MWLLSPNSTCHVISGPLLGVVWEGRREGDPLGGPCIGDTSPLENILGSGTCVTGALGPGPCGVGVQDVRSSWSVGTMGQPWKCRQWVSSGPCMTFRAWQAPLPLDRC